MSAQMFSGVSFCSGVRILGAIFGNTFFILKCLYKICWTLICQLFLLTI
jgi:hypothetical protein